MWSIGTRNQTRTAATSAMTPPSFFGIDRKMAYANRKYHSGCICTGVTRGFAGIKFSGSFRAVGASNASERIPVISTRNPTKSLNEK